MTKSQIAELQKQMQALGLYEGEIDGLWGPRSQAGFDAMSNLSTQRDSACVPKKVESTGLCIAWSAKVSREFVDRVQWIVEALKMPASGCHDLMACMAWESGETFSPSIVNGAGSGATGLIQFMPATARGMGITVEQLSLLTAEQQLDYVYKYFLPYKGRLKNLGDLYMAILWPAAIGKPDNHVLWTRDARPTTYRQNIGLDVDKNGAITRGECIVKVNQKLTKGLQPEYRRAA